MKILYTFLLSVFSMVVFAQANRTFVQTFPAGSADVVHIVLPGQIEVTRWNNTTIRVLTQVELPGRNDSVLRAMVQSGRYQLRYDVTGSAARLGSAMLEKEAVINGQSVREKLVFKIMVPEWMEIMPADLDESEETKAGLLSF